MALDAMTAAEDKKRQAAAAAKTDKKSASQGQKQASPAGVSAKTEEDARKELSVKLTNDLKSIRGETQRMIQVNARNG